MTAKDKILKHRRHRKTSMRDAAVGMETFILRWGRPLARMDQRVAQGSVRGMLEDRSPGDRTSSRRRSVDGGRTSHEAGRRGERPKGKCQQEPTSPCTGLRGMCLLDLSFPSRRPLPRRDFWLIHSFIHSIIYSSFRQLSTCYTVRFLVPTSVRISLLFVACSLLVACTCLPVHCLSEAFRKW